MINILRAKLDDDSIKLSYLKQEVLDALRMSNLIGKKWAYIGDSTSGYCGSPFPTLISAQTGCTLRNLSLSGYHMMETGDGKSILGKINELDGSEDYVTIMMGANDRAILVPGTMFSAGTTLNTDTSTFYGAYNSAMLNIISKCPGSRLGIMTMLPHGTDRNASVSLQINTIIKTVAAHFSVRVLDCYNETQLPCTLDAINTAYYQGDRLHPNDAGHAIIARKIKTFLESL